MFIFYSVVFTNRFSAAIEELWVGYGITEVGAHYVGLQSFGRLVGHLDSILQHCHREVLTGVAGQPKSELWVSCVRVHLL